MKTSELVSKLKSMGYQVKAKHMSLGYMVFVYTPDGKYAGKVCTKVFGTLSTDTWVTTSGKSDYDTDDVNNLVDTLTTYALTPLDEREDTKKYVVKMLPRGDNYLNQDINDKHIAFSSKDETEIFKTHFTEKEYRKLQSKYQSKYSQWLPKFDTKDPHFIEVQEDEYEECKLHDSELMYPDEELTRTYSKVPIG